MVEARFALAEGPTLTGHDVEPGQDDREEVQVCLVGAGPGDPGLLTVRALIRLQEADVVLYDNLVTDEILQLVPVHAEKIFVGKQRANHSMAQDDIHALMVARARAGRRVVRLKSGDPFVFGRGGEEIEALARAGVRCEIVPGVTAALGAAARAGIPLTHRDHAQSCTWVTGHLKDGSLELDWPALVHPNQTVVVYMGLAGLPTLCTRLIEHGRAPHTPAAIVQRATRSDEAIVVGSLETLPGLALAQGLHAPTLTIVGEVVGVPARLRAWLAQAPAPSDRD